LDAVAKAIYLLNFYSGLSMCPATVWITSGPRSHCKNITALAAEIFFHKHGSSSGALGFQHFESRRTIYSYLDFGLKNSSFRLPYQRPSSSANCTRELFNALNGLASLVDCTWKKTFGWGLRIFCDWRHKSSSFRVILAHVAWPRAQPLGQSVSLKVSLETRLESESFKPLINFLAFLVQKLW